MRRMSARTRIAALSIAAAAIRAGAEPREFAEDVPL